MSKRQTPSVDFSTRNKSRDEMDFKSITVYNNQSELGVHSHSMDLTANMTQFSTFSPSPRGKFEPNIADNSCLLSERVTMQKKLHEQIKQQPSQNTLTLHRLIKVNTNDPYKNIKVLHQVKMDYLQHRIRWDDNKIIREYFGGQLTDKGQIINNIQKDSVRLPKYLPHQFQHRIQPKRQGITSVLEINPQQFESSLRSCSRRLRAEKYQLLQRYLDPQRWEKLFGKTEMMKRREQKVNLLNTRNERFLQKVQNDIQLKNQIVIQDEGDGIDFQMNTKEIIPSKERKLMSLNLVNANV